MNDLVRGHPAARFWELCAWHGMSAPPWHTELSSVHAEPHNTQAVCCATASSPSSLWVLQARWDFLSSALNRQTHQPLAGQYCLPLTGPKNEWRAQV